MGREIFSLNGQDWSFTLLPPNTFPDKIDNNFISKLNWLPAQVPGCIQKDLLNQGKIPDPFYGKNANKIFWIDKYPLLYKKEFNYKKSASCRTFLNFWGIDYEALIYLNEKLLGENTGMFSPVEYEITDKIKDINQLLIYFYPIKKFQKRSRTLKCQMSYGWDFAPRILTRGLWDKVELITTHRLKIKDLFIKTKLKGLPLRKQGTPLGRLAKIYIFLQIDAPEDMEVKIYLKIKGKNFKAEIEEKCFSLNLKKGIKEYEISYLLSSPYLWYPRDLGFPHLYNLSLEIRDKDGFLLDNLNTNFGIRTVKMKKNPHSPSETVPWTFVLNSAELFIRGANWVPTTSLIGCETKERYKTLVELAKEININMFRVWGGGLREKKEFYEACDEEGILVWQEFPFACVLLDTYPKNEKFLSLVEKEVQGIIRFLRNHPSVVLFCGGNEYSPTKNKHLIDRLSSQTLKFDGTRIFHPVSPAKGDSHNWLIWHGFAPFSIYKEDLSEFASEFGLQSAPAVESLKKFIPEEHLYPVKPLLSFLSYDLGIIPPFILERIFHLFYLTKKAVNSSYWYYHNAQLRKLFRYAKIFRSKIGGLEDLVKATQYAQSTALQVAIEHYRRRKYKCSGILFWQFNEPWPAIGWSVIDYYLKPKESYYKLKEIYNPLLISLDYELKKYKSGDKFKAGVYVCNDYKKEWKEVEAKIEIVDEERNKTYPVWEKKINLEEDTVAKIDDLKIILPAEGSRFKIRAKIKKENNILSENSYDLGWEDKFNIPVYKLFDKIFKKLME